jgi:hypothetical protein
MPDQHPRRGGCDRHIPQHKPFFVTNCPIRGIDDRNRALSAKGTLQTSQETPSPEEDSGH